MLKIVNTPNKQRRQVLVRLRQDKGGYPPFGFEGLWARPAENGLWQIDNIPFYARGISNVDTVAIKEEADSGELRYRKVVQKGGHTTLRVYFSDGDDVASTRRQLKKLGCSTEVSNLPKLVAIDVLPDADYAEVRALLRTLKRQDILEYEDACVQHRRPSG